MSGWKEECSSVVMKQISIALTIDKWKVLRDEAARRRTSMSGLVNKWIEPQMKKLEKNGGVK